MSLEHEWLREIGELLQKAGLTVIEAFPEGTMPYLSNPVAAVELKNIDAGDGQAMIGIHILSPRSLGGWECQCTAARAAGQLRGADLECTGKQMEYLNRSDCYCIVLIVRMPVYCANGAWHRGELWQVRINDQQMPFVNGFSAEQDQDRRLVGAVCQSTPVGVTPGRSSGWRIRLVQKIPSGKTIPAMPAEPFELAVRQGNRGYLFRGCCWDREKCGYTQAGEVLERWGYALSREESSWTN